MRDRQVFEEFTLSNGIRVFSYELDVPIVMGKIIVPIGSIHNHPSHRGGTAHYLEHIVLKRSKEFPERDGYGKFIESLGGQMNACTQYPRTAFDFSAPADAWFSAWQGCFHGTFNPLLHEEDVDLERNVIRSERRSKERFFPGTDQEEQWLLTQFLNQAPISIEQRLGSDDDLMLMSSADLSRMQQYYYDKKVKVIIGGGYERKELRMLLEILEDLTLPHDTPFEHEGGWINREYREVPLSDVGRPTYYRRGLLSWTGSVQKNVGMSVLMNTLTSSRESILTSWLRHEKGWTYGVKATTHPYYNKIGWTIKTPVEKIEQAHTVRLELDSRVRAGLSDQKFVTQEVERQIRRFAFYYPSLAKILESAEECLAKWDRVPSEAEHKELIVSFGQPGALLSLWEEMQENTADVLLLPGK